MDGEAPPVPPLPGADMTGISFRDQVWLNSYTLNQNVVFDYFALSSFYDWTCNNEELRRQSVHPLDISHLSKMKGIEYGLSEVVEPNLFVIRKQKRDGPDKVLPILTYYVLDGTVYQAPQLSNIFKARVGRTIFHISKAFNIAHSKLEKIGYVNSEDDVNAPNLKSAKENVDFKELKRVDDILAKLQRNLPSVPPPPPFPEGYTPPPTTEGGWFQNQELDQQSLVVDPIIDQGPAKRMKL